jgi:hypothetical protein
MKKFMIILVMFCLNLNIALVSAANEQKGNSTPNVEKVEKKSDPKQDTNPVVGTLTRKNGQTYDIHRGPRGGEYYWAVASKGKSQGQWVRRYPTKEEKTQIKYKK